MNCRIVAGLGCGTQRCQRDALAANQVQLAFAAMMSVRQSEWGGFSRPRQKWLKAWCRMFEATRSEELESWNTSVCVVSVISSMCSGVMCANSV
eukprot:1245129-Rhodomonas_salina.1